MWRLQRIESEFFRGEVLRTSLCVCVGCGEGAGGANRDEAGDGVVHEDAREGYL